MKMQENDTHFLGFFKNILMLGLYYFDFFSCLSYDIQIHIKLKLSDNFLKNNFKNVIKI